MSTMSDPTKPVGMIVGDGPPPSRFVQETLVQMTRIVLPMELDASTPVLRLGMYLRYIYYLSVDYSSPHAQNRHAQARLTSR